MLTNNERAALIRKLEDAGATVGISAALVKDREVDRDTVALLQTAASNIADAIERIRIAT